MYYAVDNTYGNESSFGFSNTWNVYAFETKKQRDKYVQLFSPNNISVQAIKRIEIKDYLKTPKPFSGEAYRLDYSFTSCNIIVSNDATFPKLNK